MDKEQQQRVRVQALEDQNWASAEEHLEDIERLCEHGMPTCPRDAQIIRKCLAMVAAGIYQRRSERTE